MHDARVHSELPESTGSALDPSEPELWDLAWGQPEVDPSVLARAIDRELHRGDWDFRTRLLIRDSSEALRQFWGEGRWAEWLGQDPVRLRVESIRREELGGPGFHLTKEKIVPATRPDTVRDYFRDLGSRLARPVRIEIGEAISLILSGYLSRATADIDVVDEVPETIRSERELLSQLEARHGLALTHFQSHYLPDGWRQRLHSLGTFGRLEVARVDPYDIFLCKLFSSRLKDLDDLRAMRSRIEKAVLVERLAETAGAFFGEPSLRENAERNWYILFDEPIPSPE